VALVMAKLRANVHLMMWNQAAAGHHWVMNHHAATNRWTTVLNGLHVIISSSPWLSPHYTAIWIDVTHLLIAAAREPVRTGSHSVSIEGWIEGLLLHVVGHTLHHVIIKLTRNRLLICWVVWLLVELVRTLMLHAVCWLLTIHLVTIRHSILRPFLD
jgi:hypothetical protein